jgi:hypothetical protein
MNLTRLRESLKISTFAMQNMFSSGTISGCVIFGIILHSTTLTSKWAYDSFVIIGSFIVLQSIIFGIIAKLSFAKESIEDITKSSEFAVKFLSRKSNENFSYVVMENASTLDYWLITDILSEDWLNFSVMGIPIHSISFLKQCISLSSVILILVNTGTLTIFDR